MNVRQHDRGRPPSSTTWSLARKEGWRDFVDADRRERPESLTVRQIRRLSERARTIYDG
jgi:hypothetical protein